MFDRVSYFNSHSTINAIYVEQALAIAYHMYETDETEVAFRWLIEKLNELVDLSRSYGLDAYVERLEKEDKPEEWLSML